MSLATDGVLAVLFALRKQLLLDDACKKPEPRVDYLSVELNALYCGFIVNIVAPFVAAECLVASILSIQNIIIEDCSNIEESKTLSNFEFECNIIYLRLIFNFVDHYDYLERAESVRFNESLNLRETGIRVDEKQWLKRLERRQLLEHQSATVCDKLLSVGLDLRAPPSSEPLYQVAGFTDSVELADNQRYKKSMFIPSVAKMLRSKNSLKLEAYLTEHPRGKYARYMVVTNGQRISWLDPDKREKVTDFHARIAYMAREMKRVWGSRSLFERPKRRFGSMLTRLSMACIFMRTSSSSRRTSGRRVFRSS